MTLQFEGVGFGTGTGSGGKIGTVVLVAMGSQPSTPYTVGSKWFYNGKIYTATTTTAHDSGVVPSYDTAYLYNGTYYYWDGSTLQGADESNLVHISGTETITGNKTFSGKADFQGETTVVTQPTSDSSQKAASTQFVKDYVEDGDWQKPSDWVDIRSGALDNSIYFLVAHSKPVLNNGVYTIADYAKFSFLANVSNSGNFDVWIDGEKWQTFSSGATVVIDWASLYTAGTIIGGYDISHPSNLTSHVVRITPSSASETITSLYSVHIDSQNNQGVLWVHLEIENSIMCSHLIGAGGSASIYNLLAEAITAKNDTIKLIFPQSGTTGFYQIAYGASSLKKLPVFDCVDKTIDTRTANSPFLNCPVRKVVIKNNNETLNFSILSSFKGEEIEAENPLAFYTVSLTSNLASDMSNLKKLPKISQTQKGVYIVIRNAPSLEPTQINESFNDERKAIRAYGNSSNQLNIVGYIVSSSAPFDYETAPQINISYTNMNRAALVRLFNSMPTVSDGQEIDVTGAIGAGDLTAEDIAIATGKGWTVTR